MTWPELAIYSHGPEWNNPRMKLWLLVVLLSTPLFAQIMTKTEHQDYMNKFAAAAANWRAEVNAIDVQAMDFKSYSEGKTVEKSKDQIMEEIKLLSRFLAKNRANHRLSTDILIEESLGDIADSMWALSSNINMFASNNSEESVKLADLAYEAAHLQGDFRKHIDAYADMLEDKVLLESARKALKK